MPVLGVGRVAGQAALVRAALGRERLPRARVRPGAPGVVGGGVAGLAGLGADAVARRARASGSARTREERGRDVDGGRTGPGV